MFEMKFASSLSLNKNIRCCRETARRSVSVGTQLIQGINFYKRLRFLCAVFFCFYFVLTLNDLEHAKITFTLLKLINSFYNAVWHVLEILLTNFERRNITINPLDSNGNSSATSNNTNLVHWPLMGGFLHLLQRGGVWTGCSPAQSPPRCTKCNNPSINGQYINHCIAIWWSVAVRF